MDSAPTKQEPKPPPIYIYDVNNYKAMVDDLTKVVEEETYHTKALPNNTIKVIPHISDTYRKLIHHVREAGVVHYTYQIKQDRAYRIVIRGLRHSIPVSDISDELNGKGHKVRNIINIKQRVSKEPLTLFFVDLEPQSNNKVIFKLDFLQHCKIRIESPRRKHTVMQCTRCQDYGRSKSYCTTPFKCVKCGAQHATTCKKTRVTPAKCILCNENHPANYNGCTVYRDLINSRNKDNPRKKYQSQNYPQYTSPTHKLCSSHHKIRTKNHWKTADSNH
jgi:PAX-interacting protein 1